MNDTQLLEIEDSIKNAKAECIRQISNANAYKECVDKSLITERLTAGILGDDWPSIEEQVSLIYVDLVIEKDITNKEYEELKAAYLTKLAKSSGLWKFN